MTSSDEETVLICGVPPEAFVKIDELLGEFHLRSTYDRATLEMRRVLHGVTWENYRQFMEAMSE